MNDSRKSTRRWINLLAPLLALATTGLPAATVTPQEDTQLVLHNPDMGWVFYEFGKKMQSGYTFPEVDYVAIGTHWSDLERSEGKYDFSKLDKFYDYWAAQGKKVMLRSMIEDVGTSTPGYILRRLAASEIQEREMIGRPGSYKEVDCRNPFYQARLAAFLSALAQHYSPSGSRPIVTADLRGYGLWGEWHSGFVFPGMPKPGTQDPAQIDLRARTNALRQLIDLWSAHMPEITLLLSYSHDPDSPSAYWNDPRHYQDYLAYSAYDHATNKANISWRRDGCGGALKDNERTFNEYLFQIGKAPLFSEFANPYDAKLAAWAVDDALSLHPNYVCLYGYSSHVFHDNHRELFHRGLRTMGYRFVPTAVTYPDRIERNAPLKVEAVWVNRAVGRSVIDYSLTVILKDASGQDVFSADAGTLGCSRWIKGEQFPVAKTVTPAGLAPGEYRLCLKMVDPRTKLPIALPLKARNSDGSYPVGSIVVE